MTFLLDSNVCVHMLWKKGNPLVRQRLRARKPFEIRLCSVVLGELLHGAETSQDPIGHWSRVVQFAAPYRSLVFDDAAAAEFAQLRAVLGRQGRPIGPYDLQIAAIALVHSLTLVTHNTAEFGRVPGLAMEDWEVP
jgi:tRNA(fMet)-specific endonuclease VapC